MLVLSRKSGQELVIGDNIRITVNRVSGSRVTLGISAPDDVRIVRAELDPIIRSFQESGEKTNPVIGKTDDDAVAESMRAAAGSKSHDGNDPSGSASGCVTFKPADLNSMSPSYSPVERRIH